MNAFIFDSCKSVHFGCGELNAVGEIARSMSTGRVLLITDPGLLETGIVERAMTSLRTAGIEGFLFSKVKADPPEDIIGEAVELALQASASAVIGLGGGSSLDVAKLVALIAGSGERLADIYGIGRAKGPRLPLVLIPTTAGTGSEVTPIAIVTTQSSEKMGVVSPVLLPDIAILDPELTFGLPPHITAATGIDAMVHAIEAYASASPRNNPMSRILAETALTVMGRSLLAAVRDGGDVQARSDMLFGSMLAGQAFANSPVAAVHALAYPLGGHYHIPHGLSNALVLPHVLRFNAETAPEPYRKIAHLAFPELAGVSEDQRVFAFCDKLEALSRECGLPQRLRDAGVPETALEMLATDAMKQTRLLVNNPRPVKFENALAIYRRAY